MDMVEPLETSRLQIAGVARDRYHQDREVAICWLEIF